MADCECEGESQSEHDSPGPVADPEWLLRLCYTPHHLHEDGRLKESALSKQDLIRRDPSAPEARGCSVYRRDYMRMPNVQSTAERQMEKLPDGQQPRVYALLTADVRALRYEGGRSFCVVDRALPDDPSHAEFWGVRPGRGKAMLGLLRKQLVDLMNQTVGEPVTLAPPVPIYSADPPESDIAEGSHGA